MNIISEEVFRSTLTELERSLTVELIASRELLWFDADYPALRANTEMRQRDFSQAPVKQDGKTIGIYMLESEGILGQVQKCMKRIDDSLLVSKDASLRGLIDQLADEPPPFRLVVGEIGVVGIVTTSDLQKLPVRLLAFSLVTHLESVMVDLIRRLCPREKDWLHHLNAVDEYTCTSPACPNRRSVRAVLRGRQESLRKSGIAPDLLDLTDFRQKYMILAHVIDLGTNFEDDLSKINKWLRNSVAHSRDITPSDSHLQRFSEDIRATENWTKMLGERLMELLLADDSVSRSIRHESL